MVCSKEVIKVADSCYEMYLLEELENMPFMLKELQSSAPHLTESQNKEAVYLAAQWKVLEKNRNYLPH